MTDLADDAVHTGGVLALGADVDWPDTVAADAARAARPTSSGRLADVVEWLAAAQGRFPPTRPTRARLMAFTALPAAAVTLAESVGLGIHELELPAGADVPRALAAGAGAADREVDAGADLIVVHAPSASPAAAVLVGLLTDAEPVALLPRGPAATDTAVWIAAAADLRDRRRRVSSLRSRPDPLLEALGDPVLAAVAGFVLRAAARRTPLVLDGPGAVAAALLGHDVQARSSRWWRVADSSLDPVQTRAVRAVDQEPLLGLDTAPGDGVAGALAVAVLHAAVSIGEQWKDTA